MADHHNGEAPSEEGVDVHTLTISRRHAETAILAVVFAVAVAAFVAGLSIRSNSDDVVGAHTFPIALSAILAALSLWLIVSAQRPPADDVITLKRPVGLIVGMLLLVSFPPLVEAVGYYLLIIPWLLLFGWAARVRSLFLISITLLTVIFVARVIFQMILGTPMP